MKDWTWSDFAAFIIASLVFLAGGFACGYLQGGMDMLRWLAAHP